MYRGYDTEPKKSQIIMNKNKTSQCTSSRRFVSFGLCFSVSREVVSHEICLSVPLLRGLCPGRLPRSSSAFGPSNVGHERARSSTESLPHHTVDPYRVFVAELAVDYVGSLPHVSSPFFQECNTLTQLEFIRQYFALSRREF